MRKFLLLLISFLAIPQFYSPAQDGGSNPYLVDLSRSFSKSIFETNGVPYLEPMVEAINATSNSRFFNQAFVPTKVDKPYFRVGIHTMMSFVPNSKKTYNPYLPNKQLTFDELVEGDYVTYDILSGSVNVKDTAGLIFAIFKGMMYDGIQGNVLKVPSETATILGNQDGAFNLKSEQYGDTTLQYLLHNLSLGVQIPGLDTDKLFYVLDPEVQKQLDSLLGLFPKEFDLPAGADISMLFAGVPQFEIGSWHGTELLLRFIPPVNMGENIGDFAFWGFGLKHSISQYFNKGDKPYQRYFDMAVQVAYQGTSLENKVGVTNADLKADVTMFDINVHASKSWEGIIDVYGGLAVEMITIKSDYTYYLPIVLQWQLGMIDQEAKDKDGNYLSVDENGYPNNSQPTPGHPGDTDPQTAHMELDDTNIKMILGVTKTIGPVAIFLDYNLSKFHMLTAGVEYRF